MEFFQGRHTDGQWAPANSVNITNHLANANQEQTELSLHIR